MKSLPLPACAWPVRTLDATELAADRCKLLKLESKIRYEQERQQLQQQFSARRSSKEAQALLAGSSSTAGGQPAAAAAAAAGKPRWRQQLEQVLAVNALRGRRLVEKVVELGMISLPSPFQVGRRDDSTCESYAGTNVYGMLQVQCPRHVPYAACLAANCAMFGSALCAPMTRAGSGKVM
jgi:hypothetical protein